MKAENRTYNGTYTSDDYNCLLWLIVTQVPSVPRTTQSDPHNHDPSTSETSFAHKIKFNCPSQLQCQAWSGPASPQLIPSQSSFTPPEPLVFLFLDSGAHIGSHGHHTFYLSRNMVLLISELLIFPSFMFRALGLPVIMFHPKLSPYP